MARPLRGSYVGGKRLRNIGVQRALDQQRFRPTMDITIFNYQYILVISRPSSCKSNSTRTLCLAALRSVT